MTRRAETDALARAVGFGLPDQYNASRLLWDNPARNSDRPAILCDAGHWTYRELTDRAARIGNALLRRGCRAGDRVLLFMNDEPAYPAAIMGAGDVPRQYSSR